jgi:hypothetical protein
MGWSIGYDTRWKRDIGYGVPAICDHPDCNSEIDRGLAHVCGGEPYGGEHGCGLFFCDSHLYLSNHRPGFYCFQCWTESTPFSPKPDTQEWIQWKLTDESWAEWRAKHPEEVTALQSSIPTPCATEREMW